MHTRANTASLRQFRARQINTLNLDVVHAYLHHGDAIQVELACDCLAMAGNGAHVLDTCLVKLLGHSNSSIRSKALLILKKRDYDPARVAKLFRAGICTHLAHLLSMQDHRLHALQLMQTLLLASTKDDITTLVENAIEIIHAQLGGTELHEQGDNRELQYAMIAAINAGCDATVLPAPEEVEFAALMALLRPSLPVLGYRAFI